MHYPIIIILVIIIIGFQVKSFYSTIKKIRLYKGIFPPSSDAYKIKGVSITEGDEDVDSDVSGQSEPVSQIYVQTSSETLTNITSALNSYLKKNRGAASDFNLMKDVVERYCNSEEEEITIQQPIPLYLGLIGTMVGIIFGITFIAFSGGLSVSVNGNLEGDLMMSHINDLMNCVAIAMAASFFGVLFTTIIAWKSKDAVSVVQSDKNQFYSWLQTELLPVLSGDAVNAIYLLQQNLMSFNRRFESNVTSLDKVLAKVSSTSKDQIRLVDMVKDIDVGKVAQANIRVLKELKSCTSEISLFNEYLHSVSGYLTSVNALNTNLNEHLNRTAAIEKMGAFFESEIAQVSAREKYINQVVADVDDTLKKTFEALSESVKSGVIELRSKSAGEYTEIVSVANAQQESFIKAMSEQQSAMLEVIRERKEEFSASLARQEKSLSEKNSVLSNISNDINKLVESQSSIKNLTAAVTEQNKNLERLLDAISKSGKHTYGVQNTMQHDGMRDSLSRFIKWGQLICIVLIIIAFMMFSYKFVAGFI